MKTNFFIIISLLAAIYLFNSCSVDNKQEEKKINITIVNSTKNGKDTSFTINNNANKEEVEKIIYNITKQKVKLSSDQPHNIYVFQFTDDQVDIPSNNVYVVDVHQIMEKFDTAVQQTRNELKELHHEIKKVKVDSVIQEIIKNLKEIDIAVDKTNIDKVKNELQTSAEAIKNTRIIVITGESKKDTVR